MPTMKVKIKHGGKTHEDLELNTDAPPTAFKQLVYERTGVPLDRMKIMVKGGVLKDDSDWKKVAPKEGQTFMVIGAAGELPKPPEKPVVFLEDMDDAALAEALALPVGMNNLGNTCYMNATLQVLRAIPELQTALSSYTPSSAVPGQPEGHSGLTRAMKDMYTSLRTTVGSFTPLAFLNVLRQAFPQFGERARVGKGGMGGYAQQDAEECYVQILNALRALPAPEQGEGTPRGQFIERYMTGEMRRELTCDEASDEEPTVTTEKVLKLECNITINTNFLHTGIMDALDQKIEKRSPSLGREAVYTAKSRLSRIPANLTVHMVRFAWKRDIGKKAKIMRKVKFPLEFDVLDLCTDELKQKLQPVNTKLKEFERDRAERRKVRKRTKEAQPSAGPSVSAAPDVEMTDAPGAAEGGPSSPVVTQAPIAVDISEPMSEDASLKQKGKAVEGGALEPESVYRRQELAELEALLPAEVRADVGCSPTGLYELVGIVAHKGAAADAGHYIGFVKKSVFYPVKVGGEGESNALEEDDEDWYKFDDEKVSIFPKEKLSSLEGGGEDAAAYVLLYRSKPLA